jgi:hypothetical protein
LQREAAQTAEAAREAVARDADIYSERAFPPEWDNLPLEALQAKLRYLRFDCFNRQSLARAAYQRLAEARGLA